MWTTFLKAQQRADVPLMKYDIRWTNVES